MLVNTAYTYMYHRTLEFVDPLPLQIANISIHKSVLSAQITENVPANNCHPEVAFSMSLSDSLPHLLSLFQFNSVVNI